MSEWQIVYKKAIYPDGTLLFPTRLTKEFLEGQRRVLGSFLFANQYLNEVIPDDERKFRREWLRHYDVLPDIKHTFCFVDPAIGQERTHDFTGIAIIDVDVDGNWYLRVANHYRITPTEIINKIFDIQQEFKCNAIGIESVAYQEALLYIIEEEIRKRKIIVPVKGIIRSRISKQTRILGLVPRFEWGKIFINRGMSEFEDEYFDFPRASHDDILDALASLEEVVFYPERKVQTLVKPNSPTDPNYERWYIQNQLASSNRRREQE